MGKASPLAAASKSDRLSKLDKRSQAVTAPPLARPPSRGDRPCPTDWVGVGNRLPRFLLQRGNWVPLFGLASQRLQCYRQRLRTAPGQPAFAGGADQRQPPVPNHSADVADLLASRRVGYVMKQQLGGAAAVRLRQLDGSVLPVRARGPCGRFLSRAIRQGYHITTGPNPEFQRFPAQAPAP